MDSVARYYYPGQGDSVLKHAFLCFHYSASNCLVFSICSKEGIFFSILLWSFDRSLENPDLLIMCNFLRHWNPVITALSERVSQLWALQGTALWSFPFPLHAARPGEAVPSAEPPEFGLSPKRDPLCLKVRVKGGV